MLRGFCSHRGDACDVFRFQGSDQVNSVSAPSLLAAALSRRRAEDLLRDANNDANNVAALFYDDLKETNVSHMLTSVC